MDLGLKGKKALVTGGTRGIGRAIAERLASEGSDVAICARNAVEVAETVATLEELGVRATGTNVDVGDELALKVGFYTIVILWREFERLLRFFTMTKTRI